ncbi:hypothetical protein M9H77_18490 [Catharanthus roseus]|uniref:Uncharacterized protein n=1 Tax=Catharanthus roseus TaxID=4058 RepID=A0ACC0B7N1_CATRO|nr:hypothetical protein M9H77_18490 [Catharanthus roseus]
MSNDNIGNVDDDMVEESHVCRMKKDAYYIADHLLPNFTVHIGRGSDTTSLAASSWWDIRSGGRGVHLNPSPVTELHRQATIEDGTAGAVADLHEELRAPWANSASVRRGRTATETSSSGDYLAEEEDCSEPYKREPGGPIGSSYSKGPSYFPNLTANQWGRKSPHYTELQPNNPARRSPTRQRKEKPTQPNRTVQAPDSSDPAPPTLARPSGPNPAQQPQPSSPGPTEIPSDDGTA